MYPEHIVNPMKEELTSNGFSELKADDDIKDLIKKNTSVIVVNSVCGCAAANARPGILGSLQNEKFPPIYSPFLLELIKKLLNLQEI